MGELPLYSLYSSVFVGVLREQINYAIVV